MKAPRLLPTRRRGVALMMALIAVTIATVVAYTFLATQSTSIGIARNTAGGSRARFVAESGLELTLTLITADSTWRTSKTAGVWVTNQAFGPGTFTVRVDDGIDTDGDGTIEGDGDLANSDGDPVTITVAGTVNGSVHQVRATVTPKLNTKTVLYTVANPSSLTAVEASRKSLIEDWEWGVTLIDDNSTQSQFDAACAEADLALVSDAVTALGTKLKSQMLGVVNEDGQSLTSFGFSSAFTSFTAADSDRISVTDNTQFITQPFSLGTLITGGANIQIDYPSGTLAAGLVTLATRVGSSTTRELVTIDVGGDLNGGGSAAARRVYLPYGRYLSSDLNAEGQTILQRAMEWADASTGAKTFGITSQGGSAQKGVNNKQIGAQVTLAEPGTVVSISAYIKGTATSQQVRYAIYSNTASNQPGTLLAQSALANITTTSVAWRKINITPLDLAAGTYWLALSFNSSSLRYRYTSTGGQLRYNNNNATTGSGFSSSWGTPTATYTRNMSIFATYTPATGGSGGSTGISYSIDDDCIDWIQ